MNADKYRKLYLQESLNAFTMVTFYVEFKMMQVYRNQSIEILDYGKNHPRVISGEAYWINSNRLCIGYILANKPGVFRPVFQYKRQYLLNKLHGESHRKFWYNIYLRYLLSLPKILPIDCANYICSFLYLQFNRHNCV